MSGLAKQEFTLVCHIVWNNGRLAHAVVFGLSAAECALNSARSAARDNGFHCPDASELSLKTCVFISPLGAATTVTPTWIALLV